MQLRSKKNLGNAPKQVAQTAQVPDESVSVPYAQDSEPLPAQKQEENKPNSVDVEAQPKSLQVSGTTTSTVLVSPKKDETTLVGLKAQCRPKRKWESVPFQPTKRSHKSRCTKTTEGQGPKTSLRSVPAPLRKDGNGKVAPSAIKALATSEKILDAVTPPQKHKTLERKSRLRSLLQRSGSMKLSDLHKEQNTVVKQIEKPTLKRPASSPQSPDGPSASTTTGILKTSADVVGSEKKADGSLNVKLDSHHHKTRVVRDASPHSVPKNSSVAEDGQVDELLAPPLPTKRILRSNATVSSPTVRDDNAERIDVISAGSHEQKDTAEIPKQGEAPKPDSKESTVPDDQSPGKNQHTAVVGSEKKADGSLNVKLDSHHHTTRVVRDASPHSVPKNSSVAEDGQVDELLAPPLPTKRILRSNATVSAPTVSDDNAERIDVISAGLHEQKDTAEIPKPSEAPKPDSKESTVPDDQSPGKNQHSPKYANENVPLNSSESVFDLEESDDKDFIPDVEPSEDSDEEIVFRRVKRKLRTDQEVLSSTKNRRVLKKKEKDETKTSLKQSSDLKSDGIVKLSTATSNPTLFPNRYILNDGNTLAFRYTLQSGKKFTVYQWDTFHMSPLRFLSENSLIVCADLILRHHDVGPAQGFELIDETFLLEEIFRTKKPNLSRFGIKLPRWDAIFESQMVFLPVFKSNHWSLVALTGCSDILQVVWTKSYPGNPSPKRPVQIVAAHFDSLPSIGHRENISNIKLFIQTGIEALWKRKQESCPEDGLILPDIRGIINSSIKVMHCDVEQQVDGVSCGWRTIQHMLHIAKTGVKSPKALLQLVKKKLALDFQETTNLALSLAQKLIRPGNTDIPSLTYPLHSLVEAEKLSYFNATPEDLPERACASIRNATGNGDTDDLDDADEVQHVNKNATKKAQANAILKISERVASEMKTKRLDKKWVMRKEIQISERMCLDIAKYMFHYPVGKQYSDCLYYTRYSYPDSFLVCIGVEVLFSPTARIFGEFISASSTRVKRSRAVHFQMDMFKSISRAATRYYDETARFRLQEMVEHFRGVAEAILKSCAKEVLAASETKSRAKGLKHGTDDHSETSAETSKAFPEGSNEACSSTLRVQEVSDEDADDVDRVVKEPEEPSWDFSTSVVFQPPVHNELGTIKSNVSARDIAEDLDTCLKTADYVANEAIVSCIGPFEKSCRRHLQLKDRSVKVNSVKYRVTGESLATIPSTFASTFLSLLRKEIREIWGQDLQPSFIDGTLELLLSRLMIAANSIYRRNGQVFLNILRTDEVLDLNTDGITVAKKKPVSVGNELPLLSKAKEQHDSPPLRATAVTNFISFGLGYCTDMKVGADEYPPHYNELFFLILYVFKGCHSKNVKELSYISDEELNKYSGKPTFGEHFSDVMKKRDQALQELEAAKSQPWWEDGSVTIRHRIKLLKMKVLRRISSLMTAPNVLLMSNSLFSYEVPTTNNQKPNTDQHVTCGKSFTVFHGLGQGMEDVLWNLSVHEIASCSFLDDDNVIYRSGPDALLGGVLVSKQKLPTISVMSMKAEVICTADVWNETDFHVQKQQYLGLRQFDPVKVILSIHNTDVEDPLHPLKSDYHHCFVGFVFEKPTASSNSGPQRGSTAADIERALCIGPMKLELEVVLQDDLYQSSGIAVTLSSFVERWSETSTSQRSCHVVPVNALSVREEAFQYFALMNFGVTPPMFKLAILDLNMAESYEEERRKREYQLMRHVIAENPFQRHKFTSLKQLEDEHMEMIRSVAGFFDKELSDAQYHVIQKTLYGWSSDSSPNGSRVLGIVTEEMKVHLRGSGTIAKDDLAWWGSNLCVLDGCPGSGKSRLIAVLICSVMQSMTMPGSMYGYRGKPRVLIVTVSSSAMEDLFCTVCDVFRTCYNQNRTKYRQALRKMICVGSHSTKELVRTRQASYLKAGGSIASVVENASVVFTTISDLQKKSAFGELPFSLLVMDEAGFLEDESLIEAISIAFIRSKTAEDFQRATILLSGNHFCGDGSLSLKSYDGSNLFRRTLGHMTECCGIMRASLFKQYRMSLPLRKFMASIGLQNCSNIHGNEELRDEVSPGKGVAVEDDFLTSLESRNNCPLRSIMVVDTSLDKKNAFANSSSNNPFNKWEAVTVRHLLSKWMNGKSSESTQMQKRVTVICAYARQRIEISKELASNGLSRVQVRTLDQVMGVDNDIIVISLVDTTLNEESRHGGEMKLFPPPPNTFEWMHLSCLRARKALIVVGFGKHFCEQNSCWSMFFKKCLKKTKADLTGACGYYRPRFISGTEDFKLASFSPSYASE